MGAELTCDLLRHRIETDASKMLIRKEITAHDRALVSTLQQHSSSAAATRYVCHAETELSAEAAEAAVVADVVAGLVNAVAEEAEQAAEPADGDMVPVDMVEAALHEHPVKLARRAVEDPSAGQAVGTLTVPEIAVDVFLRNGGRNLTVSMWEIENTDWHDWFKSYGAFNSLPTLEELISALTTASP